MRMDMYMYIYPRRCETQSITITFMPFSRFSLPPPLPNSLAAHLIFLAISMGRRWEWVQWRQIVHERKKIHFLKSNKTCLSSMGSLNWMNMLCCVHNATWYVFHGLFALFTQLPIFYSLVVTSAEAFSFLPGFLIFFSSSFFLFSFWGVCVTYARIFGFCLSNPHKIGSEHFWPIKANSSTHSQYSYICNVHENLPMDFTFFLKNHLTMFPWFFVSACRFICSVAGTYWPLFDFEWPFADKLVVIPYWSWKWYQNHLFAAT